MSNLSFQDWLKKYHPYYNPLTDYGGLQEHNLKSEYEQYTSVGNKIFDDLVGNKISGLEAQGQLLQNNYSMTSEQQQYLNNVLAQDSSDDAHEKTKELQDRQYLSGASQLEKLGLNPATIASAGAVGLGSAHSADFSKANPAHERAIDEFNQKAQTTRTILSLVSGLAAAGIHGGAMFAAKNAAAKIAASTAHSASTIQYVFDKNGNPIGHTITDKQYQ